MEQYSFDIQRQLGRQRWSSRPGFIGSRGHAPGTGRRATLDQSNPKYLSLGSRSQRKVDQPLYNQGGVLNVGNPTISRSQLLLPFPQFTGVTR